MTGLSSKGEATVLAALTGNFFVSLHTADPGDTGAAEVPFGVGGYNRQGPVPFANAGNNPTISSNSAIVAYGTAAADWGSIAFFGCWDAIAGGNFQGSGPLDVIRQVLSGDTVRFLVGALKLTAD